MSRPVAEAFARLSDLSALASLREKLSTPEIAGKLEQVPAEYRDTVRSTLQAIQCDADSVSVQSPLGAIAMRIVERQAPNKVRLEAEKSPIPATLTLNLQPAGEAATNLQVVIEADIPFLMRGMLSGPLAKAADGLANVLAMV